jgi:peptidoglycan DL-endopeptidase LytE
MKRIIILVITSILIFTSSPAKAQHIVKSGDSLSKIAKTYHMTLKDLISLNPHIKNPNLIKPNDYIIIRSRTETKADLVAYAQSLQSVTAYKYGGNNPPALTDCSGWVKYIYNRFGVTLPRTSNEQSKTGLPVKFEDLQIGDLMFFSTRADKRITHTGIFIGNDFWISNLNEKMDVEILSTWGTWAREHFMWGTRYEM